VSAPTADWSSLHADALVVGESGVLARGPSGAGKSSLALALIARAREAATFAALIGDDRVLVRACGGRLLARGVPRFAGLIERRFEGLVAVAHEPSAIVRLVVDLVGHDQSAPRLPEESEKFAEILGVRLPRVALDPAQGALDHAYAVLESLARLI
jgi:serine kinase of HPr protein (carbohydrate metabolism regulator)